MHHLRAAANGKSDAIFFSTRRNSLFLFLRPPWLFMNSKKPQLIRAASKIYCNWSETFNLNNNQNGYDILCHAIWKIMFRLLLLRLLCNSTTPHFMAMIVNIYRNLYFHFATKLSYSSWKSSWRKKYTETKRQERNNIVGDNWVPMNVFLQVHTKISVFIVSVAVRVSNNRWTILQTLSGRRKKQRENWTTTFSSNNLVNMYVAVNFTASGRMNPTNTAAYSIQWQTTAKTEYIFDRRSYNWTVRWLWCRYFGRKFVGISIIHAPSCWSFIFFVKGKSEINKNECICGWKSWIFFKFSCTGVGAIERR